jgi:hypothetical protein
MNLFEAINVWKRVSDGELVLYRCFKNLTTGKFSVQSADTYRLPLDPKRAAFLEQNSLQLLAEMAPDDRSSGFATLVEAIADHERDFDSNS